MCEVCMLENIIPLLDNATCSVIMIIVLWRFDSTVRLMARMQKEMTDELLEIIAEGVTDAAKRV